jgi:rhodanese-related sulfurtransferase
MPNPYGAPEIDPGDFARKIEANQDFVVLDVREAWELARASLKDPRLLYAPLSQLAHLGQAGLPEPVQDKSVPVVVICHHGVRSAEVAAWLLAQGWREVHSLAGGLEAYAVQVDASIGRY